MGLISTQRLILGFLVLEQLLAIFISFFGLLPNWVLLCNFVIRNESSSPLQNEKKKILIQL